MFTNEHIFDASVITLIDEGDELPLFADVVITAYDDSVVIEQTDPDTNKTAQVTLSLSQLSDLAAALNLPEGSYRLTAEP